MTPPPVALVAGSGKKRIGWHVAAALAERGYHLVVHYRTSAAEAGEAVTTFRRHGGEILALQADLGDEAVALRFFLDRVIDRVLGREYTGKWQESSPGCSLFLAVRLGSSLYSLFFRSSSEAKSCFSVVSLGDGAVSR